MKKENNPVSQEKFKTLIGGQAPIEGIMMQGPDRGPYQKGRAA